MGGDRESMRAGVMKACGLFQWTNDGKVKKKGAEAAVRSLRRIGAGGREGERERDKQRKRERGDTYSLAAF